MVSEVMLQQTQAERVRPLFEAFMARFPTPAALAEAEPGDAIRAWGNLGYPRRAVNLHRAAREIFERFGGEVPRTSEELRTLPGIGPYTASAIACFAFGVAEPVVETNVRRVLARHRLGVEPRESEDRRIHALAAEVLPVESASDWSQALMDLARDVCRSAPRCGDCPVAATCEYVRAGRKPMRAPNGRSQARFEGSVRQARGRIMALLRERSAATVADVAQAAGVDEAEAGPLIDGLERDGLCVRSGEGRLRLP